MAHGSPFLTPRLPRERIKGGGDETERREEGNHQFTCAAAFTHGHGHALALAHLLREFIIHAYIPTTTTTSSTIAFHISLFS
jgi:hypothetical protein